MFNTSPTPLGRVLRGTAMPEDIAFAKSQLSSGLRDLSRSPVGSVQADAIMRVTRGSCAIEDSCLARQGLNHILKPIR